MEMATHHTYIDGNISLQKNNVNNLELTEEKSTTSQTQEDPNNLLQNLGQKNTEKILLNNIAKQVNNNQMDSVEKKPTNDNIIFPDQLEQQAEAQQTQVQPNRSIPEKMEFCNSWIRDNDFDDTADQSSIADSTVYTSSVTESDFSDLLNDVDAIKLGTDKHEGIRVVERRDNNKIVTLGDGNAPVQVNQTDILQHIFNGDNISQSYGNIKIEKSSNIHIGNITYVTGPIHIVHTGTGNAGTFNNGAPSAKSEDQTQSAPNNNANDGEQVDGEEQVERNRDDIFIGRIPQAIDSNVLRMVDRRTWLAQPPTEPAVIISEPVPYVIISHTATESSTTQAGMIYMVRNIQTFHIESRQWNDIGYNFLIGGDGNVYEGRGWSRVGAHTYGYNKKSIGISFVGCFMNMSPQQISIDACKLLIKKGVSDGYIAEDYKLLAHCQCSATESPGRVLYDEIRTWPHWTNEP